MSLIRAYARIGLEALITDAGWSVGGWPAGMGNWTPDPQKYPQGMALVAAAARENGMVYGLWFEPERVVAGTEIHRMHPAWCLSAGPEPQSRYLLNFGLPEVQDYVFNIVKGFMDLPGFGFYRQDFNMDHLRHWRYNEPPDRRGIVEIRYIEGLYAYWERIAAAWPDSIREECASGGRRIDLETVRRMHIHQESDYWFDNDADQSQIMGLSQYLPNNCFTTPLNRLDDYSFHSTMATSLCLGWIADGPGFDQARAQEILSTYLSLRHLLVGAWYPLLPSSRDPANWMGSQWHRPDLDEGMILLFRRAESPFPIGELRLQGLDPQAEYELSFEVAGKKVRNRGAELMKMLRITMSQRPSSELIRYRRVAQQKLVTLRLTRSGPLSYGGENKTEGTS